MGVGRFNWLRAKSAAVNSCCRNLVPKTNTGSLPAVKFSVNMMRGSIGARASLTPACDAFVSARAALCMGLLASVICAASASVNGVATCAVVPAASAITTTTNATTRHCLRRSEIRSAPPILTRRPTQGFRLEQSHRSIGSPRSASPSRPPSSTSSPRDGSRRAMHAQRSPLR